MSNVHLVQYKSTRVRLSEEEAHFVRTDLAKRVKLATTRERGVLNARVDGFVGTVALGSGRSLIIEPRIPIGVLFALIAEVYDPERSVFRDDRCTYSTVDALFEFVVAEFVGEAEEIISSGLRREYESVVAEESSVRGRLLVHQMARRSASFSTRFPCSYEVLTYDLPENRVLRHTVAFLSGRRYRLKGLAERLWRLEGALASVPMDDHAEDLFGEIHFHRLNERYRTALSLAKLLLAEQSHSGGAGDAQFRGFLLNMDQLFERYLGSVLDRSLRPLGLRAREQCESSLDQGSEFRIRPDLVIVRDRKPVLIVDAKDKLKPSREDLHQAITYCVTYGLRDAMLVYPSVDGSRERTLDITGSSGIRVHIHLFDLSGDIPTLGHEADRLVRRIIALASDGSGSAGSGGVA